MSKIAPEEFKVIKKRQSSKDETPQEIGENPEDFIQGEEQKGEDEKLKKSKELLLTIENKETELEEYFREHLHKRTNILEGEGEVAEAVPKTRCGKCKATCLVHLKIFLAVFSRKLFLRHRNIFTTLVEVFLSPLMICIVISVFTRGVSWDKAYHERQIYDQAQLRFPETEVEDIKTYFRTRFCDTSGRIFLIYYPDTTLVRSILQQVIDEFDIELNNKFHNASDPSGCDHTQKSCEKLGLLAAKSEEELLEMALIHRKDYRKHKEPIGVIFEYPEWKKDNGKTPIIPEILKYRLRFFNEEISSTSEDFPYVEAARTNTKVSAYVQSGFLGLQYAIEEGYLDIVDDAIQDILIKGENATNLVNVKGLDLPRLLKELKESKQHYKFPRKDDLTTWPLRIFKMYHYPNFFTLPLRKLIVQVLCLSILFSYGCFTYFIVKQVVTENETGIKDLLKMHNMPMFLHWVLLGLHTLLLRAITSILVTIFLFVDFENGSIFRRSDYFLVFLFIYSHMISLSCFNFFLSTIFDNVFLSGCYAIIIGIGSYAIPLSFQQIGLVNRIGNIATCFLFPNWGFVNGMTQIIEQEVEDKGMAFDNIFELPNKDFCSMFAILIMFAINSVLYFGIAVLGDITKQKRLSPGSFKWYQCKKALKVKSLRKRDHAEFVKDLAKHLKNEDFEKPSVYEGERIGENKCIVHVRNVFVSHGKNNIILDKISMNIYHGEITIILGHTGSGKTCFLQIIAGMFTPTHGYATILGYDINYDKKKASKFVGFGPQKIILFNLLTVEEHLTTCYRLRGLGHIAAKRNAAALLSLMKLTEVSKKLPSDLTDTNKRKLSIAVALVDSPKVILLDEPTFGLDSMSRREIWSLLMELRKHHTIIIGTNRMDEAEYLGDRIALLSHGKLVCYGTPNYLKKQYDTGYFLKITPEENFDKDTTCQIINNHLDEYPKQYAADEMYTDKLNEVRLEIPKNKIPRFPKMLEELDEKKKDLGITAYSISQVSIYDIFIKICDAISMHNEPPDKSFRRNCSDTRRKYFDGLTLPSDLELKHEKFKPSRCNAANALFKKRITYMKAKQDFLIWEFLIPLLLIFIVTYHARIFDTDMPDTVSKELSLSNYPKAEIYYRLGTLGDSEYVLKRDYAEKIKEILKENGVKLPNTQQVLTQFENKTSFIDGYAREKHLIGLEFRLFQRNERQELNQELEAKSYFQFVGYYSSGALHSPPIIMNLISNVILSAMFPYEHSTRKIIVSNEPFPTNFSSAVVTRCDTTCLLFAIISSIAISFFVASLIVFPKYEENTGMKHLQLMTGLHPILYWGTQFICDFVVSLIFGIIASIMFAVDESPLETFTSMEKAKPLWSLGAPLLVYLTWSAIPFAYFLSAVLPEKSKGYLIYIIIHGGLGWLPLLLIEMGNYHTENLSSGTIFSRNFFHLFPMFTISTVLYRWFEIDSSRSLCSTIPKKVSDVCAITSGHGDHDSMTRKSLYNYILTDDIEFAQCCERVCNSKGVRGQKKCFLPPEYYDWSKESLEKPQLLYCIIVLAIQGFLYWGILIILERGVLTNIIHNAVLKFIKTHTKVSREKRSPEVEAEKIKCEYIATNKIVLEDMALVCHNLKKSYATIMVVNDVNLAVKKGECICVLGGNGSGKSTFIRLLCGQTLATTGEVIIAESSIHHHRVNFLKHIGYCPQNFCFFDTFNAREMLELMGRLRGIPKNQLSQHVNQWLQTFGLENLTKIKCKDLTKGLQRCVCVAMSIIGGCDIILLDEPTSLCCPISRQKIWAVIKLLVRTGRTVIFSSYNCEECTYLGNRMIVFCEGNVQCLGNPLELIARFAKGFTILIRVRHDILTPIEIQSSTMGRVVKLKHSMKQKFKHLTLRDEQDNLLLYFLRDIKISWADIFRKLEQVRDENENIIEKYYISEATLEDVFVLLTNKYREMNAPRYMASPQAGELTQEQAEKEALGLATKNTDFKV